VEVLGLFYKYQPWGGVILLLVLDIIDEDRVIYSSQPYRPLRTSPLLELPLLCLEDLILLDKGVL
jgi:hypothetical protein